MDVPVAANTLGTLGAVSPTKLGQNAFTNNIV